VTDLTGRSEGSASAAVTWWLQARRDWRNSRRPGDPSAVRCRFGSHAPLAVLRGWREMFKVLAGAVGLVGVMGSHSASAFGAAHEFSTVSKRLLHGDLCWYVCPSDHTIFENRPHFCTPPACASPIDITRFCRAARLVLRRREGTTSLRLADS
jgi:hypothetical protein